jgi:glycosyltransferase involved in cell wall biosynthesis
VRILFVHDRCGWLGGVEQNVSDSAAGLRERGHSCFLAHGPDTDRDPDGFRAGFDGAWPARECGAGDRTVAEVAIGCRADVVYYHKIPRLPDRVPTGIASVRMVHDHDLCCPRSHKYHLIDSSVCRHRADWRCWLDLAFLARTGPLPWGLSLVSIPAHAAEMRRNRDRIDRVLVGSRFMRDELLDNGFAADRVSVLPPAARLRVPEAVREPEGDTVLFVGQLIRGKGADLLLRALAGLAVPFHAVLAGDGNARPSLQELAAGLGLRDRVTFAGFVSHDAIDRLYAEARVVVVPSRWPEPFGMVGVEAAFHGRPVVAFEVGGIPDWLRHGEGGLLVPEGDVAGLSVALGRVLAEPGLAAALGRRGRARAARDFAFDRLVDGLERALRDAMGAG